jgi:Pentapeptide repeats (8 copies)
VSFLRRVDPDRAAYNAKRDASPGKNKFATLHFMSRSRILGQLGQAWRTEPEIDEERQKYLAERQAIVPDIEKSIYPFKDIKLSRADVEWLLAMHENRRGPVDGDDERQWDRSGLELRGANLQGAHLEGVNLTREHLEETNLREAHLEGAKLLRTRLEGAALPDAHLEGADLRGAHLEEVHLRRTHLEGANLQ